jgi:hypothetical protein
MDLSGSWAYLEQVASHRLENNKTAWHISRYGTDIELLGAAGELAARRYLGLPERLGEHFDGGYDLSYKGYTIDVKATHLTPRLAYRSLQWPEWKPLKADIVLMTAVDLKEKIAAMVGYAYKHEVLEAHINHERAVPCHEIPTISLHPTWELLAVRIYG